VLQTVGRNSSFSFKPWVELSLEIWLCLEM